MAAGEEKILVSVRVRPLNEKEKARNDGCDWECVNNNTIICKYHNLPDKPSYTFDKVFGFECPTKQVYDDGAKEVALCVLSGINSSIFAYGQTSSGKTYTMSGITEFAMDDIFDYIEKHKQDREFTLKFSAMEIYNEAVRDLLCEDSNTPLRLLDDPERGTVVEKLKEETLTDRNHLEELLSICETQRKIGETSMNETSSRSHQILRLTIESSGREFSPDSSATLAASVCFVDLAGSERASQTLSAGSRLKEGCHINRSLLTLGTVIRKLSKGKNGHIPYRDSKLTRILQNSLGGNAKTAIICTMSPARSHLEQSRNTLLFASCAKQVTTNAQVNLVVSQKALVKQLQRELARMENELKNLGPASSAASTSEFYALLKQKEELISKMEEQIQELKWQRDVAQSQVENLLKTSMEERSYASSMHNRRISYDSTDFDEPHMLNNFGKSNLYSPDEDGFLLEDTTPEFPQHDLYDKWGELAPKTTQGTENAYKEVRCIEVEGQEKSALAESVKIQDSLDNVVVEKKAESLPAEREYKSFAVDEKAENEDMELSLYAEPKAKDELTVNKLVESQDTTTSMEKEDKNMSSSAQKLEARDEPTIEKLVTSEKTEQFVEKDDIKKSCSEQKVAAKDELTTEKLVTSEEIEKEDKNMSLSEQKVAAKDELTTEKLVTSKEIEKSVEKEDKNMSLSGQKVAAKDELTTEKLGTSKEIEKSVEKGDKNMSLSEQKVAAKDELTTEKLVTSKEIEKSVEKEDKNTSLSGQKVAAKNELTTEKLGTSKEIEKSVEKEDKNMSLSEQKVAAKDELTTEKLVTSKEIERSMEKDKNMSWSAPKLETKDEPTIEKLVTSEKTKQSVQTEDKNMISWSARKLEAKAELAVEKLVTSEENEQYVDEEDNNMSFPAQKVAAKDELTTEKLVKSDELSTGKLVKSQETEKPVEKEDKNMSWSEEKQSNKEDMEQNSGRNESAQLTKSPPKEENYVQVNADLDKDDDTYEALKKKVKEMQKTIEYFISMQLAEEKQSPSFKIDMSPRDYLKKIGDKTSPRDYLKLKKSRSCRENLLFSRTSSFGERFAGKTSNISFDSDDTSDTNSMKDSDHTETSNSSFHEFMAGLKKMAMHHESTHEHDHIDAETKKVEPENRDADTVSNDKAEFERQQSQIIELWEVCNVPLLHRTYFFLLFKGDPSDFVYMEVELRRLSFLKDSPETMKRQNVKALTREREWLAKQIPKKYGKKQREEIYKKWDVELSSKQRSMQVSNKLWINTKDIEHCQESASLVASLVGFVDSNLTPKEMFGLTFSPTLFNIKPSGWRFTNSFSRISLTGGL